MQVKQTKKVSMDLDADLVKRADVQRKKLKRTRTYLIEYALEKLLTELESKDAKETKSN